MGSIERMNAFKLLFRACRFVAAVALVLFSRRKGTQLTSRDGQGTLDQGIQQESNKPRALEWVGLFTTVAAFIALIYSHQSVQSSNRAAESARRAVQLQEAQLQPVFLVQLDYDVGISRPTRQK